MKRCSSSHVGQGKNNKPATADLHTLAKAVELLQFKQSVTAGIKELESKVSQLEAKARVSYLVKREEGESKEDFVARRQILYNKRAYAKRLKRDEGILALSRLESRTPNTIQQIPATNPYDAAFLNV